MKKIIAIAMAALLACSFVGCSSSGDNTQQPANTPVSAPAKTTGSLSIDILSATVTKDDTGKDAVVVTYKFKNGTSKTQNFKFVVGVKIKQGDKVLEPAVVSNMPEGYDAEASQKQLKTDEEIEVMAAYVLSDTKTALDVECTPKSGEKKDPITKQLPLA